MPWKLLSEAYEHVLAHESRGKLATRELMLALSEGEVRARGYVVYAHGAEGLEEPLSRDLWTADPSQQIWPAQVDWSRNSAKMGEGQAHPACTVFRIEVDHSQLLARWPDGKLKRGREPVHDPENILAQAEDDWRVNGSTKLLKEWVARVMDRLGSTSPRKSYLNKLLGPKFKQRKIR